MSLEICANYGVPKHIIYKAFTNEFDLSRITRCKAQFDNTEGGEFNLYDGKIIGKNLKLSENEKFVQEWKMNDWSQVSKVTFEFYEIDETETEVLIKHEGLPSSMDPKKMKGGWIQMILMPMSQLGGFPITNMDELNN